MRLTHIYINIICEAHSHLHTTSVRLTHIYIINIICEAQLTFIHMSVRLTHTWVTTARLTHSYMYAGYRLGAHSHLHTTSVRLTPLYMHAVVSLWAGSGIRGWVGD